MTAMPVQETAKLERRIAGQEAFLFRFIARIGRVTESWSTTRLWTKRSLLSCIRQTREELVGEGQSSIESSKSLLEWMVRLGIARRLPIEEQEFYVVDIDPTDEAIDPYELLGAAAPNGVICYLSAVAFHSLTTQPVIHHHVATLDNRCGNKSLKTAIAARAGASSPPTNRKERFGRPLISYRGATFHVTSRSARLVPGVQLREAGPRFRLRITSYEQTLIDTLYKPFHCGGPEVVFEAWQTASFDRRIDEVRLADYLSRMAYPATTRRVGVMLSLVGIEPGKALRETLDRAKEAIDRHAEFATISLLPGVPYRSVDQNWLVLTP
jgi:predicted transcriptional regulator of viral defense system